MDAYSNKVVVRNKNINDKKIKIFHHKAINKNNNTSQRSSENTEIEKVAKVDLIHLGD